MTGALEPVLTEAQTKQLTEGFGSLLSATEVFKLGWRCGVKAARAAAAAPVTGCLHPTECQRLGLCQSASCKHAGKVVHPRVCVEAPVDGVLYPKIEVTK